MTAIQGPTVQASEAGSDDQSGGSGAVPVRVTVLRSGFSPRLEGENADHVRVLAEAEGPMPPILVHRASMRVIDGMHRLEAAKLRGAETILVEFFAGSEDHAYLIALKRNATHGYPLSSADRDAAVQRILNAHPDWSDRAIAAATGISAKTVGKIRRRSTSSGPSTRRGQDGRSRPLDPSDGRRRATELIKQNPNAPLRAIARQAGISVSTAHDVRHRLRIGQDPVPTKHRRPDADGRRGQWQDEPQPTAQPDRAVKPASWVDHAAILDSLKRDPSLRFNETGRQLLQLLAATALHLTDQLEHIAETIPEHSVTPIATLADDFASAWEALSKRLRRRRAAS